MNSSIRISLKVVSMLETQTNSGTLHNSIPAHTPNPTESVPSSEFWATIGYLVPEFPGQTHIFLWRERQALRDIGVESRIISTKRPPQGIMSHAWSGEAQAITTYLFPLSLRESWLVLSDLLKAGPQKWWHCLQRVVQAEEMSPGQKLRLAALIPFAAKLVRLAREQGWSHIHVTTCGDSANIAMFAALLGGITYSLSLLGPDIETYGPNQKQKWQYAAFGLFQSERLQREAQVQLAGYLPKDITFAPVGVNLDVMKRQHPYVLWNGNEPCRLYSCGRLNPVKGHNYVIEAVELLRQQGINAQLQIAGEDEQGGKGYRQVLEALIREKHLSDYVQLLGAVSEERNRQAYQEAHLYVMGSLNETAGAVATMEAMAMEVPVVMTNVGSTSELIDHEVDALLVEPERPQELADAMVRLLNDSSLAMKLGAAARQKIAAKFSHRRSAEQIAEYLKRVI